jgi:two-component system cell cycle sensor histidine kinase/response regulator CckA
MNVSLFQPRFRSFPKVVPAIACLATILTTGLVLTGWRLDQAVLKSIFPGLPPMLPSTALGMALTAAALWLLRTEPVPRRLRWVAWVCTGVVALGSLVTLAECLPGWHVGLERLLAPDTADASQTAVLDRPAFLSALASLLLGLALGVLDSRPRHGPLPAELLALLAALVALLALLGYACGVPSFYGAISSLSYAGMALPTAVLIVLLAGGILCARPNRGLMAILRSGGVGGLVAHRLLLLPVLIPLLVGWLHLTWRRAGLYNPELGGWLFSLSNVVVFTLVIWWCAATLHRIDALRKRAEDDRLRMHEELEERVHQRTAELARANGELQKEIDDRKRAEQTLQDREQRYRQLVELNPDGMLLHGGREIAFANRACLNLLGASCPEEVLGKSLVTLIHPDFHATVEGRIRHLLEGGAEVPFLEQKWFRLDGGRIDVEVGAMGYPDQGGRSIQVIVRDITQRRRLEEQLRQAQKMEAIGQLAGGVAHDFNNLLTIICGYGEIVLASLHADDPARQLIGEMTHAGERAASLTRQLLAFSRQQVIAPQVLDLNAVVDQTDKMLRRMIGEDVALTSVLAPTLGRVKVDPSQVEQVLMNLAVNARDAMPQGGKLTIETRDVELDAAYAGLCPGVLPGWYVLLAVSDTGCGMDAATKARIFEPFFTTKGLGKGTGLGLSTVYGIVKQSGGHIEVYSELAKGTAFKVYLPRVEAEPRFSQPSTSFSGNPTGSETLLLVEDEDAVRGLACLSLHLSGYTLLEARTSAEAIRIGEQHPGRIDLLVTDVVMPDMGGRELSARLTALRPGLKVLYLSGYTDDAVVRHGVLSAEVAFLQKPFTVAALTRKVREVLDQGTSSSAEANLIMGCRGPSG